MDYITLYLIMATVCLLLINSLIVVSNMKKSEETSSTSESELVEKTPGLGVSYGTGTGTGTTESSTSSIAHEGEGEGNWGSRSLWGRHGHGSVQPWFLFFKGTERTACVAENTTSSSLSVGTNSAAILGTTLFLLVNFESAMDYNWVFPFSETFAYGEAPLSVKDLADTLFCQASTSYKYFSKFLLLLTFIVVISVKPYILKETGLLVLLSTVGILLMASSTNFISFYLALELISLASYILVSTTITDHMHNGDVSQTKSGEGHRGHPTTHGSVAHNSPQPKKGCVSLLVYADNSIVAGLNYFLLSALSSGLLVLGISLIYYTTGELDFNSLARIFSSNSSYVDSALNGNALPLQSVYTALNTPWTCSIHLPQPSVGSGIGMCLVMTFVLFKLGASPFHYWVADVYEKVSIFVNYFLIVVAKLAMLFALMKLSFGMNLPLVENLLIVASVSSLLIGSFAGLVQTKLRRLMAFSSINHVGYILLAYSFSLTKKVFFGVSEGEWERGGELLGLDQGSMILTEFSKLSIASLWLYVTIYSLSTVSFFAILSLAVENGKPDSTAYNLSTNITLQRLNTLTIFNINQNKGEEGRGVMPSSNPQGEGMPFIPSPIFITASLTITLLSLAGVPPLAGFIAKIAIFWQVLDSGNWFLATVAVLCSVIAAIYYLRIVALLYFSAAHPNTKIKSTESAGDGAAAFVNNKPTTTPTENLCVNLTRNYPSSVTFLTALIIATITIILVVFPLLNPSFMYLYMING